MLTSTPHHASLILAHSLLSMATALKNKTGGITYEEIVQDIVAGRFSPVYLFMGEESYYIDSLTEKLVDALIPEEQRDFDLTTFFGADTEIDQVIMAAREFPMVAQRKVVVLREAQALPPPNGKEKLQRLELYLRQPQPNTVLIVCYKGSSIDRRSKLVSSATKLGTVFTSDKLPPRTLPTFVRNYAKHKGAAIEADAAVALADFVGNDLSRLASEIDKLIIAKPAAVPSITRELIIRHIGMSKEFNIFELQDALVQKSAFKAYQIIQYFTANPKENPPMRYLPVLFKFFSNILIAHYSPDKSETGLAAWLGMSPGQIKYGILPAMRTFSAVKALNTLSMIRKTDVRTKGVGNTSISDYDLMRELIYYILS